MNKQEKYNPDVNKKYDQVTKERDHINYSFSNQVYKGITNDFPKNVTKSDDLKMKTDEPDYDIIKQKMENAIRERENEKMTQEKLLKELAERKITKKLVISTTSTTDAQESFQDMKSSYQKFNVNKSDKLLKEKLVINDVLDFIKKL